MEGRREEKRGNVEETEMRKGKNSNHKKGEQVMMLLLFGLWVESTSQTGSTPASSTTQFTLV